MTVLAWTFLITGLLLPVAVRWLERRRGWRTHPARRPEGTLPLALCVAPWMGLAGFVGAGNSSVAPSWLAMAVVVAAGGTWVEAVFLLWRPFEVSDGSRVSGRDPDGSGEDGAEPDAEGGSDRERSAEDELTPESRRLLERIHRLSTVPVEQVMTPRDQVIFAESTEPLQAALARMQESRHTRLVVTEGNANRILGIVHTKDLVRAVVKGSEDRPVRNHLRRWLRVPAGRSLSRVLEDFRRNRLHIGVVSDVRGRTLGLVTLTDVMDYVSRFDGGEP